MSRTCDGNDGLGIFMIERDVLIKTILVFLLDYSIGLRK